MTFETGTSASASLFAWTQAAIRCQVRPATFPGCDYCHAVLGRPADETGGCVDGSDATTHAERDLEADANHGLSGNDELAPRRQVLQALS